MYERPKKPCDFGLASSDSSSQRLIVATTGAWFAVEILGWDLVGVYDAIAVGMVTFGVLITAPLIIWPWRARKA